MKNSMKLVSLASATALVLSLAGCSKDAVNPTNATPGVSSTPAIASSPPVIRPDYIPEDVVMECAGIPRDTVLFTVDGKGVSAEEVLYWATYTADQYSQYTGSVDWTQDMQGSTMKEYLLDNAVEMAKAYQVVKNHAEEMGLGYNEKNKADYQSELNTMKENLAAQVSSTDKELTYLQWLATIGLSDEGFESINESSYLFKNVREGMYGAGGKEAPTDESMAAWLEESGTLRCKHILINATPSEDGTDDGMEAALAAANEIRAELKAAGDTEEKFNELMAAKSQDPGSQSQPDGYTFGPGEMVQEFYDGTKALKVGEISEPVKSSYGYHVILRLAADNDAGREQYADSKANALMDQWMEEAKVEKTAEYDKVDMEQYYAKLTELRATVESYMYPEPEATPAPTDTVAPTTTPEA